MADLVAIDTAERITTVTMRRPEARNALSPELINALGEAIARVVDSARSGDTRVMILAGEGKAFCAGMDLKGVLADPPAMAGMLRSLSEVSRAIRRLPIPTIARVQGAAVGGGCGLMIVTDFAVTHAEARVGYPEVDLGVCPAVVAPWLIKKIGAGRARHMLLTGGTITGAEGYQLGLATHLAERDDLNTAAADIAARLVKGGAQAMAVTKHWLNELDGSLEDAPFERAAELSAAVIAGEEAQQRLGRIFKR